MIQLTKFPRTPHLSWSPGATVDDKRVQAGFSIKGEVVVTEKLDGENTTLGADRIHARSLDGYPYHPSRTAIRALAASIQHAIPEGLVFVGENVFAEHSIAYRCLPAYFIVFGAYRAGIVLGWDETVMQAERLGLVTAPVLYRGAWDERIIKACYTGESRYAGQQEGYVVRAAGEFPLADYATNAAKFVRPGHVRSPDHWKSRPVVQNRLCGKREGT